LYCFGGAEVTTQSCRVISYEVEKHEGVDYRVISTDETFATYEEAANYISGQPEASRKWFRIVGDDPLYALQQGVAPSSPVPLEKLEHYESVFDSGQPGSFPEVRIFEYLK